MSKFCQTVHQNVPAGFSESDEQDVGGGGQSGGEGGGRQGAGGRGVPAARDDGQEEAQAAVQVSADTELPFRYYSLFVDMKVHFCLYFPHFWQEV